MVTVTGADVDAQGGAGGINYSGGYALNGPASAGGRVQFEALTINSGNLNVTGGVGADGGSGFPGYREGVDNTGVAGANGADVVFNGLVTMNNGNINTAGGIGGAGGAGVGFNGDVYGADGASAQGIVGGSGGAGTTNGGRGGSGGNGGGSQFLGGMQFGAAGTVDQSELNPNDPTNVLIAYYGNVTIGASISTYQADNATPLTTFFNPSATLILNGDLNSNGIAPIIVTGAIQNAYANGYAGVIATSGTQPITFNGAIDPLLGIRSISVGSTAETTFNAAILTNSIISVNDNAIATFNATTTTGGGFTLGSDGSVDGTINFGTNGADTVIRKRF